MTDKQIKEEIKQVVTNLGNIKFTVEDELEFCKKVLKRKEQECERLNRWLPIISRLEMTFGSYEKAKAIDYKSYIEQIFIELDQLKAENEILKEKLIISSNSDKKTLKIIKTLAEIKEIVQFGSRPYKVCGEHNNCCDVLNEIWNKISKCEVKND